MISSNPVLQELFEQLLSFGFSRKRVRESHDPAVVSALVMYPLSGYTIEVDLAEGAAIVSGPRGRITTMLFDPVDARSARQALGVALRRAAELLFLAAPDGRPGVTLRAVQQQEREASSDYPFQQN